MELMKIFANRTTEVVIGLILTTGLKKKIKARIDKRNK